jgi:hypothetical protein
MTVNNAAMQAALAEREDYTGRLLDGFALPLITVFEDDRELFDTVCVEIREAFAGSVFYLKQFYYDTGCEGYFVIDLPVDRVQHILSRLRTNHRCFNIVDLTLHHIQKT